MTSPAEARAVVAAGKSGNVKIVGFDASEEIVQFLKQGVIDAVVDHRQYNFGYYGTMILYCMKIFGVDNTMTCSATIRRGRSRTTSSPPRPS